MKLLGIGALIIGWILFHLSPARATTTQPAISEITAGVVIESTVLATRILLGRLLSGSANDNAAISNNHWIGWQKMGPCNASTGWVNTVSNAFGPCAPNLADPHFGIGFQWTPGLSATDCAFKHANAAQAIIGTVVPGLLALGTGSGGPITPNPALGGLYPGGTCDAGGPNGFAGWFMNEELLVSPGNLSNATCVWMVNQCTGNCSCGQYYHP